MKEIALLLLVLCFSIGSGLKIKSILQRCDKGSLPNYHTKKTETCQYKIDITLRLVTSIKDTDASHYIKVDTVYDERIEENIKLFHPLIIKVENKPVTTVYPLRFIQTVNNKPYEVFLHKDNIDNYRGCKESNLWSLCGSDEGDQIKKGFCCSCSDNQEQYHIRGGQDCTDGETPPKQDKDTYRASAHCLKFDPVWYSVNALEAPRVQHEVAVHVFCETLDDKKKNTWVSLLNGEDIIIGMRNTHENTGNGKVFMEYSGLLVKESDPLDFKNNRLLIPEPNPELDRYKQIPLQLQGNSSEFLLIDLKHFQLDGSVCDKIGVSYEAFVNQQNKCHSPAQSCLDKQPMHFWLHDMEKKILKKPFRYFLGRHVEGGNPFLLQGKDMTWYLHLKQKDSHVANIHMQINADMLLPLQGGNQGQIVQVTYADLGNTEMLNVELYNPSLLLEEYSVSIHSCNVSQYGQHTKTAQIQPHQSLVFNFALDTVISNSTKHCLVTALNIRSNQTVERVIYFRQGKICLCLRGCQCTCGDDRYRCVWMNTTNVYEEPLHQPQVGVFTSAHDFRFILAATAMIFSILGAVKAFISLVSPVHIGQFGLCLFTKNTILMHYIEKDLKNMTIIYDKDGIPVHPRTGKPVQLLPKFHLFVLNLFFGFYLPLIGLHWIMLKICKTDKYYNELREKNCWKQKLSAQQHDMNSKYVAKCLQCSPRSLNKINQELTVAQYRRTKKDIKHQMNYCVSQGSSELTPPYSDSEHLLKEKENIRSRKRKEMSTKSPLQTLLEANIVYCNFDQHTSHLRNGGDTYSLCGKLIRHRRKYRFELDKYTMQTYENRNGVRKLARSQKIPEVDHFTQILTASSVHRIVSMEPMFPCLNQV